MARAAGRGGRDAVLSFGSGRAGAPLPRGAGRRLTTWEAASRYRADDLKQQVKALGFSGVEDFDAAALNQRYFGGREDDLRVRGGHVMRARV